MNSIKSIEHTNLSLAWAEAFLELMKPGRTEISPLIVTVTSIEEDIVPEHAGIRNSLDKILKSGASCHTIANTIFPKSLWNPSKPRAVLYERYNNHAWPRIKHCPANHRGTYFKRLIAFNEDEKLGNQLEHVISTWQHGNHRHSALQLSIFDPLRDHNDCRQMGFPCLHQVCFTPLGTNGTGGLAVTGFYATQHIFEKAYGNYLGLCRLGHFVAHELKLKFVRMTCIAASARLGNVGKSEVANFATELQNILKN